AGAEFSPELLLQLAVALFGEELFFLEVGHLARVGDDEGLKIQDALEVAEREVEQVADAAGQALEKPYVRAGRGQLDVAQALAADLRQRHFHAALVADDTAMLHPLVLPAQTLPVGDGAENLGAKQ